MITLQKPESWSKISYGVTSSKFSIKVITSLKVRFNHLIKSKASSSTKMTKATLGVFPLLDMFKKAIGKFEKVIFNVLTHSNRSDFWHRDCTFNKVNKSDFQRSVIRRSDPTLIFPYYYLNITKLLTYRNQYKRNCKSVIWWLNVVSWKTLLPLKRICWTLKL